jgi:ATP-dependent Clp protease ATP-binding subunit ClpA
LGRRWISGFYIWLTSNIGSAELMSLQHSNDATLERHVLTPAQKSLRPEIFARLNEKLVFHRVSYEHQLEIAEKFLSREIEFLAAHGHRLKLDATVLPFLVRKGFHPKLGARPMRDAVEKLVGDAVSECLLDARQRAEFLRWMKPAIASSSAESAAVSEADQFHPQGDFPKTEQRQFPAMKS